MIREEVNNLFESQLEDWTAVTKNYRDWAGVKTKDLFFDGFRMKVQFNPARIRSSAAQVDEQSVRKRACFLCTENRPVEQKSIQYGEKYLILVNPFPIFPRHLTIPAVGHTDQLIKGRVGDMLSLAKDLPDYIVFYNGPKSGASAPDHFHFQAGSKGQLPIEEEVKCFKRKRLLFQQDSGCLYEMSDYLRKTLVIESADADSIVKIFESLLSVLGTMQPEEKEPMINLLADYEEGMWRLFVFPRKKHRPSHYFAEGEERVLFSPGSVDMAGMLILVRDADFLKVDETLTKKMFSEITFSKKSWEEVFQRIKFAL